MAPAPAEPDQEPARADDQSLDPVCAVDAAHADVVHVPERAAVLILDGQLQQPRELDDGHPPGSLSIVRRGPRGTVALAGTAVLIVAAIWFAFYLMVFVPRT